MDWDKVLVTTRNTALVEAPSAFPRGARVPHLCRRQIAFALYIRDGCLLTEPLLVIFNLQTVLGFIQLLRIGYATPIVLNVLFSLLPA